MKELLTIPEAARRLGISRWKMLRLIEAGEHRSKRKFAIRIRGKSQTTLRVTWPALQRYIPELFEGGGLDKLESTLRGHLREIDDRIDERAEAVCLRVIAPIRRELEDRDERVAGMVIDLAKRVSELASEDAGREKLGTAGNKPNKPDACARSEAK